MATSQQKEKAAAPKTRIPLNREFVKLGKKLLSIKGLYEGHWEKACLDVDMETGEIKLDDKAQPAYKMVRVLKFTEPTTKVPYQMFEDGGLKANREVLEEHGPKGVEIVWSGKKELDDGKKMVNTYQIYPLEKGLDS